MSEHPFFSQAKPATIINDARTIATPVFSYIYRNTCERVWENLEFIVLSTSRACS